MNWEKKFHKLRNKYERYRRDNEILCYNTQEQLVIQKIEKLLENSPAHFETIEVHCNDDTLRNSLDDLSVAHVSAILGVPLREGNLILTQDRYGTMGIFVYRDCDKLRHESFDYSCLEDLPEFLLKMYTQTELRDRYMIPTVNEL